MSRTSHTTSIIKKPGVPEARLRNSDIAKFGTKFKQRHCAQQTLPYEKFTKGKISHDEKDLKKGEMKVRHRQRDNTSAVSSANSNILKSMTAGKPPKPKLLSGRCYATLNASSAQSTPLTSKDKLQRRAPSYNGCEKNVSFIIEFDNCAVKRPRYDNPIIASVLHDLSGRSPVQEPHVI